MLNLSVKMTRTPDGKVQSHDQAVELLAELGDLQLFIDELKERINLDSRSQTHFLPTQTDEQDILEWVKATFSTLNNGRHPEASLPEKIIITLNKPLFSDFPGDVRLQDTKGIDDTANRADLAEKMNSRRTLNVLCTGFNDARDKATQSLLELAVQGGQSKYLPDETMLLVLDRPGDAENVIGVDEPVNDIDLGRAVRQEQIEQQMQQTLKLSGVDIQFHNVKQDDICSVMNVIAAKILKLQARIFNEIDIIGESVEQLCEQARKLGENPDLDIIRSTLTPWLKKASGNAGGIQDFFKELIGDIRITHQSSVRASVSRRGQWYNLDFFHVLTQISRSKLVCHFEPIQKELACLLDNVAEMVGPNLGQRG